jgi:glycosyltransferase involved in cell wall biosynthesis
MMAKKKLAYISSLPPEPSGISFYSKELLPYLSKYYDITLVVNQKKVDDSLLANYEVVDVDNFLRTFKHYDRILYHFGNSEFHKHMFDLLEEIPGVVVLHDFFLSGAINWMHHTRYKSGILLKELLLEEGIRGLIELKEKGIDYIVQKYPLNYSVINNSIGIIAHSKHFLELMKKYYNTNQQLVHIVPHLRGIREIKKDGTKSKDSFLICSFGYITPLKMHDLILTAFAESKLSKSRNIKLVFVGGCHDPLYRSKLFNLIRGYNLENKVEITGFVDESSYEYYLSTCDLAVQLRTMSRGETSRALLDVLSAGIPTIVNEHGSMKELPNDVVYKLRDNFELKDLIHALENLYENHELRKKLSRNSAEYIKTYHNPEYVAKRYFEAIESFYVHNKLIELLKSRYLAYTNEEKLGILLAKNHRPIAKKRRILLDCSVLSVNDLKTGIQRTVKAQYVGLLQKSPENVIVEPIGLTDKGGFWHFEFRRDWALKFHSVELSGLDDDVNFQKGDIYYAPDLNGPGVLEAYKAGLYDFLRLKGVKIVFLVYDLLPIEFPEYFPSGAKEIHEKWCEVVLRISDKIICVSKTTADNLIEFAKKRDLLREDLEITWLHLGFDFKIAKHTDGLSPQDLELFQKLNKNPYFLVVATIEPRKGHEQVLKAFEILWERGHNLNLVFVGKVGWMVEKLVSYMNAHPELNKRFFHLSHVSDDLLEKLYKNATAVIAASEGEGFGLPIAEAAYYKTPIIARDIPVFREIARESAYYFRNTKDPLSLAEDIERWLKLYKKGEHPKSDNLKFMSWEEHTTKLLEILLN